MRAMLEHFCLHSLGHLHALEILHRMSSTAPQAHAEVAVGTLVVISDGTEMKRSE